MLPHDLKPEHFAAYPPQAKALMIAHLDAIRELPLSFLPSLLREAIEYDFKFPAERSAIERELANISSLSHSQSIEWFHGFTQLSLSPALERSDWINLPAQFVEQEAAYLWSTHQLDAFRKAASEYGLRLAAAARPDPIPIRRWGIAIIGQGAPPYEGVLFRNLRKHGTYFGRVKPDNGLALLLSAANERAKLHPAPYAHWYVDGGQSAEHSSALTCVSYKDLEPTRAALLDYIQTEIKRPGMGPEELRTHLAKLTPADLGLSGDPVLGRFQVKLLTEGSGTQIFSTTFAQWTAREALRRAEALTLVVRFAPRQKQRPMNELLSNASSKIELDYVGSLIDADMGSYYHWINQQRLPGFEQSSFLVWLEGQNQAIAIAPSLPRGAESNSEIDVAKLISLVVG